MMKAKISTLAAAALVCALVATAALLVGCADKGSQGQSEYADDSFVQSVARGFEARAALADKTAKSSQSEEYYEKLVDAELEQVEQYQSARFEDSKLQENAISYINSLKDQRSAAGLYASDNDKFQQEWQKAYDKRTALLKTFVDDYGLTVSSDCQDDLDRLVSHGKKVERESSQKVAVESLADSINLEFAEQYSSIAGKATATNSTGYDFDYISFDVELFDASGVKVETTSLYANHWLNGETIVLDCYASLKELPASVKVIAGSYQVADSE